MSGGQPLGVVTHSADATRALGRRLGERLADAAVSAPLLLLRGDYGTGKTTFVQGLAAGLGVAEPARSPSYLIVKVYEGTARRLVHADLYRVQSAAAVDELGIDELAGPEGVVAVEWPGENLQLGDDREVIEVEFQYQDEAEQPSAVRSPRSAELLGDVTVEGPAAHTTKTSIKQPLSSVPCDADRGPRTADSSLPTPDSALRTPDILLPTPDSGLRTPDCLRTIVCSTAAPALMEVLRAIAPG